MDYEKCVFPVLCILTSLPANKLPWFCISKTCQLPPSIDVPKHFPLEGGGGGVLII